MRDYVVKQLKETVIPTLERISGVKFDIDRLREYLKKSTKAEDNLVRVLQSAKAKPSPIDAYFGGIYYIGPIFGAFRGTDDAIDYYRFLRAEVEERIAAGNSIEESLASVRQETVFTTHTPVAAANALYSREANSRRMVHSRA